jgi:hypothetical protein
MVRRSQFFTIPLLCSVIHYRTGKVEIMQQRERLTQAGEWFIGRYIHSLSGRNFALKMLHREMVSSRIRHYNARYDIAFTWVENRIAVVPLTGEAEWVTGVIYVTVAGSFQYISEAQK